MSANNINNDSMTNILNERMIDRIADNIANMLAYTIIHEIASNTAHIFIHNITKDISVWLRLLTRRRFIQKRRGALTLVSPYI